MQTFLEHFEKLLEILVISGSKYFPVGSCMFKK